MTEEEKKLTTRVNRTNEADGANEVNGTKKPQGANETNVADNGVEQSIKNLEDRAAKNYEFASSPVNIDTSGQTDWMAKLEQVRREYIESPEQKAAREQREKRNRRIAAISDGLVAMSNIAGAMAGATPIKPSTTMSAAHAKAVEDAAKRRRENADRYAIYSRYLSGLQQQQDKLNADRYDKAVKARQDADKQADNLIGTAARLRQNRENAQRAHELAKQRAEEQKRHNRVAEGQGAQRVSIAQQNANKKGKGTGGQGDDESQAYEYWESLTPEQKQMYRDRNNRSNGQIVGTKTVKGADGEDKTVIVYGNKADDKNFIMHVWEQRKGWLRNHGGGGSKKKVSGFGNSKSSGKKKIAGFGN